MTGIALSLLAAAVAIVAIIFALVCFNTWCAKREQARMARDHHWRSFIIQVKARLEDLYGESQAALILDKDGLWFHELWCTYHPRLSPGAAVERYNAEKFAPSWR